jgi:DNA polymerase-1
MLYLIDASGAICRHGFAAGSTLTRDGDGFPIGAVNGVCGMLWRLVNSAPAPTHIAMCFDTGRASSFRRKIYPGYKAQRPPLPDWLSKQFEVIKLACDAFGIPRVLVDEYEADDVIASYVRHAQEAGLDVTIVSSDKDLMQLVHEGVVMNDPKSGDTLDAQGVMDKIGVSPHQVADYLALAGDSSDNIPGVPGVGEKTAAKVLQLWGDLQTVLMQVGDDEDAQNLRIGQKIRESLRENGIAARISKKLTVLNNQLEDIPPLESLKYLGFDRDEIVMFLTGWGCKTLSDRIASGALIAA